MGTEAKTVPGSMVLLTRLARAVYRHSTEEILGMRLKGFVALCYLRGRTAATQQELGEKMMLDPNNLVLLLNELETNGYAVRRRDPEDRRRHIVELTPAGKRAIERAEHGMESVEDEVLAALNAEERANLRALLSKALEGVPGEP
jgi:DNA-binding MarR family transcriptional regulator